MNIQHARRWSVTRGFRAGSPADPHAASGRECSLPPPAGHCQAYGTRSGSDSSSWGGGGRAEGVGHWRWSSENSIEGKTKPNQTRKQKTNKKTPPQICEYLRKFQRRFGVFLKASFLPPPKKKEERLDQGSRIIYHIEDTQRLKSLTSSGQPIPNNMVKKQSVRRQQCPLDCVSS